MFWKAIQDSYSKMSDKLHMNNLKVLNKKTRVKLIYQPSGKQINVWDEIHDNIEDCTYLEQKIIADPDHERNLKRIVWDEVHTEIRP